MKLQSKFAAFAALTAIAAASGANAQQFPAPRAESQVFRFEMPARSYLGVQTENVTKDNFAKYNLTEPRGVVISKVIEDSPAAAAGLRDGDVILAFDGEPVKSAAKLTRLIGEVAPDQKAKITVSRNGAEQDFTVTIGKRAAPPTQVFNGFPQGELILPPNSVPRTMPVPPDFPRGENFEMFRRAPGESGDVLLFYSSGRKLGVSVTPLAKQLGEFFGAPDGKGLLVEAVTENSAAAKAGLKAGDIILEIDGAAVATQGDLIRAVNKKDAGEIVITILRDKQRQTVRATPEAKKQPAPNGK